jgi:hypothetical protein
MKFRVGGASACRYVIMVPRRGVGSKRAMALAFAEVR